MFTEELLGGCKGVAMQILQCVLSILKCCYGVVGACKVVAP